MSIFGWSMPPGCHSTPFDEMGVSDLTPFVKMPAGVVCVSWDEDGNLIESFPITIPADPYAGLPEYTDQSERTIGSLAWDDELDEDANFARAALFYNTLPERAA